MTKKLVWAVLSFLMVVALVLASCTTPAEKGEKQVIEGEITQEEIMVEEEEEEEEVMEEGPEMVDVTLTKTDGTTMVKSIERPQYGGQINYHITHTQINPYQGSPSPITQHLVQQPLRVQDWTLTQSGTNEVAMVLLYFPDDLVINHLVESWEIVDPTTIVFNLKEGIRWQDKAPVNGRELVADDVVFTFESYQADPRSTVYMAPGDEVEFTALDNYTVQAVLQEADSEVFTSLSRYVHMIAPESAEAEGGVDNWKNVVGVGPYILTDLVDRVSATFERNPNYFEHDPFFPENRLPYPDSLQMIVLEDEATWLAAFRTGKVDALNRWGMMDRIVKQSMVQTNPETVTYEIVPFESHIFLDTQKAPFNDRDVRYALMLAIDHEAIVEELFDGDGSSYLWPTSPVFGPEIHTAFEDQPASVQELYGYDPDKAKQLLADAGYATGFEFEVVTTPGGWAETLPVIIEYFADIGVDMTINTMEYTALQDVIYSATPDGLKKYEALAYAWGIIDPISNLTWFTTPDFLYNFDNMDDAFLNEQLTLAKATEDVTAQNAILKDIFLHTLEEMYDVVLPTAWIYYARQPWLKGWDGQMGLGGMQTYNGAFVYSWIDQELKR